MSKHTSLTFTDEASIVGRETKTQKIQDNRNICFPLLQGKKKKNQIQVSAINIY